MLAAIIALLQTPRWSLATDDTIATIAVEANRPVVEQLGNTGESHRWCKGSAVALIDHVWEGSREIPVHWQFQTGTRSDGGTKLTLVFGSEDLGQGARATVELRSIWRARKGRGPIEHWIEIVNRSQENITVPQQESLNLDAVDPGGEAAVWWTRRGATNALTEGGVFQNAVKPGLNLDLVSDHHVETSPVPWLAVQTGTTRGLYMGWEFSGRGRLAATSSSNDGLELKAGLLPDFKTDIHPGETLEIPAAFVGCYRGDIDSGSASLEKFVMEKLRANPPKDFADPTTVCGIYLDAGGDHATQATLLPTIAFAKSLGLDTFLADAMWFPACGDWRWDPARFPNGSKPIRDAIHGDGMKFALWCAWDNGGISSDPGALSVRGPAGHPDWFGEDLPANWQPGPFYGAQACMGSPEAKAWALKKTQSMAAEMGFDYLKTDVHPMINECSRTDHRHSHGTDVSYWSAMGVYEVWDELRKKFPKLVLENCSGASHIKDFGVIQRCAYTGTTDTLSNLPDRAGIYDSTFYYPPAALMTYTYEQGYGLPGDDPGSYLFRSAMMTAWDLAPTDSKDWTAEERASARAAVRTYKEWIRPILQDCSVHHVLPRPDGKHWDGMFFWSEKLRKGTLFVFRPDSEDMSQLVKLAGLDPEKKYLVWSADGSVVPDEGTGRNLMEGTMVGLPSRLSSDLIFVQDSALPKPKPWGVPGVFALDPPESESDYIGNSTTLSWNRSPGAHCYSVLVDCKRVGQSPTLSETVVYEPRIRFENLFPGAEMEWSIAAIGQGDSRGSGPQRLHIPNLKPWPGVFVSDLPWVKAEAGSDQVHRNENYLGKPLSINGKVYRKGIWTHSFNDGHPADIVVDISGKGYGAFAADAGLDDASGGGSVQFQVFVDGKLAAESPVMKPREMHPFRIDVSGAKQLTLRVLNGGDGYNSDHAVWGLSRLIKAGATDPFKR